MVNGENSLLIFFFKDLFPSDMEGKKVDLLTYTLSLPFFFFLNSGAERSNRTIDLRKKQSLKCQ
jgi:hypothetical protein